ncbi:hypothetical protein TBLA_0H00440 [Henningerozyma blattae CBS 6284]|uniref:Uncharacterized protein n=1 Tax=Henningerozyma blattae (strain ATCC 34711 / CBS 6284 / DSM 70876 / NBRC 10599 / NRRL Y-10934 / UCD 77-7) TaxID=1071380 RepID=I2H7I5_HENB6|nr:hypothetical protein TBLA_0H00440 [Tetrapisispora blattae CBS 6284]CCH62337.1 hypothetical protein TBLA_0H00440 [Tetrapisispora blattae CBS 6284]
MFGSNESGKPKRRSFFFFGNNSNSEPASTAGSTTKGTGTTSKTQSKPITKTSANKATTSITKHTLGTKHSESLSSKIAPSKHISKTKNSLGTKNLPGTKNSSGTRNSSGTSNSSIKNTTASHSTSSLPRTTVINNASANGSLSSTDHHSHNLNESIRHKQHSISTSAINSTASSHLTDKKFLLSNQTTRSSTADSRLNISAISSNHSSYNTISQTPSIPEQESNMNVSHNKSIPSLGEQHRQMTPQDNPFLMRNKNRNTPVHDEISTPSHSNSSYTNLNKNTNRHILDLTPNISKISTVSSTISEQDENINPALSLINNSVSNPNSTSKYHSTSTINSASNENRRVNSRTRRPPPPPVNINIVNNAINRSLENVSSVNESANTNTLININSTSSNNSIIKIGSNLNSVNNSHDNISNSPEINNVFASLPVISSNTHERKRSATEKLVEDIDNFISETSSPRKSSNILPTNIFTDIKSHQRTRSEAEKLVDDIDTFMSENSSKSHTSGLKINNNSTHERSESEAERLLVDIENYIAEKNLDLDDSATAGLNISHCSTNNQAISKQINDSVDDSIGPSHEVSTLAKNEPITTNKKIDIIVNTDLSNLAIDDNPIFSSHSEIKPLSFNNNNSQLMNKSSINCLGNEGNNTKKRPDPLNLVPLNNSLNTSLMNTETLLLHNSTNPFANENIYNEFVSIENLTSNSTDNKYDYNENTPDEYYDYANNVNTRETYDDESDDSEDSGNPSTNAKLHFNQENDFIRQKGFSFPTTNNELDNKEKEESSPSETSRIHGKEPIQKLVNDSFISSVSDTDNFINMVDGDLLPLFNDNRYVSINGSQSMYSEISDLHIQHSNGTGNLNDIMGSPSNNNSNTGSNLRVVNANRSDSSSILSQDTSVSSSGSNFSFIKGHEDTYNTVDDMYHTNIASSMSNSLSITNLDDNTRMNRNTIKDDNSTEDSENFSAQPRMNFRIVNESNDAIHDSASLSDESYHENNTTLDRSLGDDFANMMNNGIFGNNNIENIYVGNKNVEEGQRYSEYTKNMVDTYIRDHSRETSQDLKSDFPTGLSKDSMINTSMDSSIPETELTSSTTAGQTISSKASSVPTAITNNSGNMISAESSLSSESNVNSNVRLVSSYIEEIRLKYLPTTNFLNTPPNLPITLKSKNQLLRTKQNIKVKIRTSSKQIGIKHGAAKPKLLALETMNEEFSDKAGHGSINIRTNNIGSRKKNINHTKEFHELMNKQKNIRQDDIIEDEEEDEEEYLNYIPGDDAYDSDDMMAPLRKKSQNGKDSDNKSGKNSKSIDRNNTVLSYYTRKQRKLLGENINDESKGHALPSLDGFDGFDSGLRLANPDTDNK